MQLVYLFIEKYKNIQKQGFNFSPEFDCKFENGILTIDKNDKDIKKRPLSKLIKNISEELEFV